MATFKGLSVVLVALVLINSDQCQSTTTTDSTTVQTGTTTVSTGDPTTSTGDSTTSTGHTTTSTVTDASTSAVGTTASTVGTTTSTAATTTPSTVTAASASTVGTTASTAVTTATTTVSAASTAVSTNSTATRSSTASGASTATTTTAKTTCNRTDCPKTTGGCFNETCYCNSGFSLNETASPKTCQRTVSVTTTLNADFPSGVDPNNNDTSAFRDFKASMKTQLKAGLQRTVDGIEDVDIISIRNGSIIIIWVSVFAPTVGDNYDRVISNMGIALVKNFTSITVGGAEVNMTQTIEGTIISANMSVCQLFIAINGACAIGESCVEDMGTASCQSSNGAPKLVSSSNALVLGLSLLSVVLASRASSSCEK